MALEQQCEYELTDGALTCTHKYVHTNTQTQLQVGAMIQPTVDNV